MNAFRFISKNISILSILLIIGMGISTFTSCSSDSGGGGDSGGNSSSGSVTANILCKTDDACVEMSAETCQAFGGKPVSSCETVLPSSSSDGGNSSSVEASGSSTVNRFEAQPYAENDKIKYSYSYYDYDFYYIYLGELKNIPLFYYTSQHHNGMNSTYTVSVSTTETVTQTIERSSQEAVTIIDEYTKAPDNTQASQSVAKVVVDAAATVFFGVNVKPITDAFFDTHTETNEFKESKSTSLTKTISSGTEKTKEIKESRSFVFTRDDREGYYRYTLFSTSDVYLYIVKNSKTGQIVYYEFKEYVIPEAYSWRFDYSETSSFKKSDATSFEFDVSMLDNLPKPELVFIPSSSSMSSSSAAVLRFQKITFGGSDTLKLNSQTGTRGIILGSAQGTENTSLADFYYEVPTIVDPGNIKTGKSNVKMIIDFRRPAGSFGSLIPANADNPHNPAESIIGNPQNTSDFEFRPTNAGESEIQYPRWKYFMVRTGSTASSWTTSDYLVAVPNETPAQSGSNNKTIKIVAWKVVIQ
ncbi:MAG: hypothetical protein FWB90_08100 [Fibromonadales bacterium]|nr:hypothetical protein [Fibromonadales bacterium]